MPDYEEDMKEYNSQQKEEPKITPTDTPEGSRSNTRTINTYDHTTERHQLRILVVLRNKLHMKTLAKDHQLLFHYHPHNNHQEVVEVANPLLDQQVLETC
jgi:hypothetical protein